MAKDLLDGLEGLGSKPTKRAAIRSVITDDAAWAKIAATHERGVPYPQIAEYLTTQFKVSIDAAALADMTLEWKRAHA